MDLPARGREFQRIVNEIGKHLCKPVAIANYQWQVFRDIQPQCDIRLLCLRCELVDNTLQQRIHVHI